MTDVTQTEHWNGWFGRVLYTALLIAGLQSCQSANETRQKDPLGDVRRVNKSISAEPRSDLLMPILAGNLIQRVQARRKESVQENKEPGDSIAFDDKFVRAAHEWIVANFGAQSSGIELTLQPQSDFSTSHLISFYQSYNGTKMRGCYVNVLFEGKQPSDCSSYFFDVARIPESEKKIISSDTAVSLWRQFAEDHGSSMESIATENRSKLLKPILMYCELLNPGDHAIEGKKYSHTFNPTWVLDSRKIMCVNAQSGRVWFRYEDQ
ncbi:MAG: hypothetical protein HY286_20130 [Planctomycetes bacterium]|nr:hypothetical protein [Planctomycetota bacterium]